MLPDRWDERLVDFVWIELGVDFPLPTVKSLNDKGVKSHRLKLDGHAFVLSIQGQADGPSTQSMFHYRMVRPIS